MHKQYILHALAILILLYVADEETAFCCREFQHHHPQQNYLMLVLLQQQNIMMSVLSEFLEISSFKAVSAGHLLIAMCNLADACVVGRE